MADSDSECSKLGIPARLHRNGRSDDQNFETSECFYQRFRKNPASEEEEAKWYSYWPPSSQGDTSVNRSKECEPEDVLFDIKKGEHHIACGIVSYDLEKLQKIEFPRSDMSLRFTLDVRHDPEDCMYPHCVILVKKGNEVLNRDALSKEQKAILRRQLAKIRKMIKYAVE